MIENKVATIKDLIKELNKATEAYDKGKPYLTDKDWDDLYFQLQSLEEETGIIYPNSPTHSIHFKTVSELQKKEHEYKPMLSLDKTKDSEDIQSFVSGYEWCAMFKLDGLSCRLTYSNGVLVGAETRGNGIEGEWILHNAKVISNIPKRIPHTEETVIVDGEVICDTEVFNQYFADEYKNPRNFAAGSIRLLSSEECSKRHLRFVAWDLIKGCEDIDFFFWRLEQLDNWGFLTVPRIGDAETVEDAIKWLDEMKEITIYPLDGYVFRFESQKYYDSLGKTDHHFNGAIAYKFYDEEYETELLDIELSMGRTGILTPVAIFKPIEIDGTIVEKANLHNISVLKEILGDYPYLHQRIWVIKANQIIPQITKAAKQKIPYERIIFKSDQCIPCPICGKSTEIKESDSGVLNIVCTNPSCEGKIVNRIDHYCGKKGLNIKGLSKKTIEKLIDWGWLNGIKDLYGLEKYKNDWQSKTGFGSASVNKLLNAISAEGRHPKLESFISALGIPLVGRTASKEIVKYFDTWEDFRNAVGGNWTEFEGFGPEIDKAINSFDYTEADEIAEILTFKRVEMKSNAHKSMTAAGLTFCVTGKLNSGKWKNRNELKEYIESIEGRVVNSMSSKVNYLINNDSESQTSKNKMAKKNNIPIISEQEFIDKWGPLGK